MTRRGAEKIMSVYWFAIIFIVAAAVVYLAYVFYGKPYDVREIEVGLLNDKIADCLNRAGYINEKWQGLDSNNILIECGVNFNVENTEGWQDDQHYIEVRIADFNGGQLLKSISAGNENLKIDCDTNGKNLPVCLQREMYSVDNAGGQYEIQILSIIRKTEKNA